MPYNIRKIDPRVREGKKALGIRLPFSSELVDERYVGKPDASAPFTFNRYHVFTSTYQTKDRIKSNLASYFPEIEVKDLDLENYDNSIRLYLTYSILYAGEDDEISVNFG